MTLITLRWRVVITWRAHNGRALLDVVSFGAVGSAFDVQSVGDFALENLNLGLMHSQICHLNVQTMEMNAVHRLVDGVSEFTFTNFLNTFSIRQCAVLMEITEQVIEVNFSARMFHENRPVVTFGEGGVSSFEFVDDLWEVPWEGKHVSMLLIIELNIDA